MKRDPTGLAHVREACNRLQRKGKKVSLTTINNELLKWRGVSVLRASMIVVWHEWRRQRLLEVSGRLNAAVDAILQLTDDLERDYVKRQVCLRTGGGVKIRFTVKARNTGGGHPKKTALVRDGKTG